VNHYYNEIMENKPTSIYLPSDIKQQLVEVAEANGFHVGRGCKSDLPKFIAVMIEEYAPAKLSSTAPLLVRSLTPELRETIFKISKMGQAQQQRASQVLELIFSTWSEQDVKKVSEG
jgi:aspartate aminotransferase-like enzyme